MKRSADRRAFRIVVQVSMPLLAWAWYRGTWCYYRKNPNG